MKCSTMKKVTTRAGMGEECYLYHQRDLETAHLYLRSDTTKYD